MSRSKRKTPISGITTADSEKDDKRIYNRRFRNAHKRFLKNGSVSEPEPHIREHRDPWSMAKDGKTQFDPKKYPELMRK
jgi:hypothetical protein